MIGFVLGLLPFITFMIVARMLTRHGLTGFGRPTPLRKPLEPQRGTDARPHPPAMTSPLVTDDAVGTDPTTSPWTTLDDLQLDRLLKESSS